MENLSSLQAVLLCGGKGTRLREETEHKPKPMVLIGNKPILWHIMHIYAAFGVKNFILALGYKGDMIRDYFLNYEFYNSDFTVHLGRGKEVSFHNKIKRESNWSVTLVETGEASMTGARVKLCEPYIKNDHFFLTYGDGLSDVNLYELFEFHKNHGRLATVIGVNPPSRWGEMAVDDELRVTSFMEKEQLEALPRHVNGGFFVFRREVLNLFSHASDCVMEKEVLTRLAMESQLMVHKHHGFWYSMDTHRDYLYLNELWNSGQAAWDVKRKTCDPIFSK